MMPEEGFSDQRDTNNHDNMVSNFPDDVNALALSSKSPSSYLGASSVAAILKVVTWLQPRLRRWIECSESNDLMQYSSNVRGVVIKTRNDQPSIFNMTRNISSMPFFCNFHPQAPIVDESIFRETLFTYQRSDPRWVSLLNIVLALRSIAVTPANNKAHYLHFQESKSHLDITSLGSLHIETIQTLGLMGGLYLHYIS